MQLMALSYMLPVETAQDPHGTLLALLTYVREKNVGGQGFLASLSEDISLLETGRPPRYAWTRALEQDTELAGPAVFQLAVRLGCPPGPGNLLHIGCRTPYACAVPYVAPTASQHRDADHWFAWWRKTLQGALRPIADLFFTSL